MKWLLKPERGTKLLFSIGELVRIQNPHNREWDSTGTIESIRTASDGTVLGYNIDPTNGGTTVTHRKYLMWVVTENLPDGGNGVDVMRQGRDMAADRRVMRSRSGSDDMPSGA